MTINEDGDKTTFGSNTTDTGVSYFLPSESADGARVILQDADVLTVERLRLGEKIYGTRILNIGGMSGDDPDEVYYKRLC